MNGAHTVRPRHHTKRAHASRFTTARPGYLHSLAVPTNRPTIRPSFRASDRASERPSRSDRGRLRSAPLRRGVRREAAARRVERSAFPHQPLSPSQREDSSARRQQYAARSTTPSIAAIAVRENRMRYSRRDNERSIVSRQRAIESIATSIGDCACANLRGAFEAR